jgi:outer membrane protein
VSRFSKSLLVAGALGLAVAAIPAQAEQGDWVLKGGVTMVSPKSGNLKPSGLDGVVPDPFNISIANSSIEVDDGTSFGFTVTYMLTDNWAIDLLAAYPFKHDIGLKGTFTDLLPPGGSFTDTVKIGETKHLPPTISVQYHFLPDAMFSPYVGVGLNMTMFSSEKLNSDAQALLEALGLTNAKLQLDTSTGVAGQIGADFNFSGGWLLNADIRYIDIGTKAKVKADEATVSLGTVNIDPIVYSLMVGYRF